MLSAAAWNGDARRATDVLTIAVTGGPDGATWRDRGLCGKSSVRSSSRDDALPPDVRSAARALGALVGAPTCIRSCNVRRADRLGLVRVRRHAPLLGARRHTPADPDRLGDRRERRAETTWPRASPCCFARQFRFRRRDSKTKSRSTLTRFRALSSMRARTSRAKVREFRSLPTRLGQSLDQHWTRSKARSLARRRGEYRRKMGRRRPAGARARGPQARARAERRGDRRASKAVRDAT